MIHALEQFKTDGTSDSSLRDMCKSAALVIATCLSELGVDLLQALHFGVASIKLGLQLGTAALACQEVCLRLLQLC